jgi:hypothetical protein
MGELWEDSTPQKDHLYSLDFPGPFFPQSYADKDQYVIRFNFREFVRVKFDGQPFGNQNGSIEGSRASDRIDWRSRIDLIDPYLSTQWARNNSQPPGEVENEIDLGHKDLMQNDPR